MTGGFVFYDGCTFLLLVLFTRVTSPTLSIERKTEQILYSCNVMKESRLLALASIQGQGGNAMGEVFI